MSAAEIFVMLIEGFTYLGGGESMDMGRRAGIEGSHETNCIRGVLSWGGGGVEKEGGVP